MNKQLSIFLLVGTFLFVSCSNPERDNPDDPGSKYYSGGSSSSSSAKISSSSSSSSTKSNVVYGDSVYYKGKIYKTVVIGTQTWFQSNLNYAVDDSKCYNGSEANCDKYGRLYDWETAKKVCPENWHLPSKAEWQTLVDLAGSLNEYGFTALLGGIAWCGWDCSKPDFREEGWGGYWWVSDGDSGDSQAFGWFICNEYEKAKLSSFWTTYLLSVRCIKDKEGVEKK